MNGIPESQRSEFARDATVPIGIENGTIKVIPLSQGLVTIVDVEDYDRLNSYEWQVAKDGDAFYAIRTDRGNGNRSTVRMHREILGLTKNDGIIVDHRDMNGLNNTKSNIRRADKTLNNLNKILQSNNTSGYRGVTWHKSQSKWVSFIKVNGKKIYLGRYDTAIDAALAYDEASRKYYGSDGYINVPIINEAILRALCTQEGVEV